MNATRSAKSLWLSIFARKGASGDIAGPWDDCDTARRAELLESVNLGESEEPVLVGGLSVTDRVILTTHHLMWGSSRMRIVDIASVSPVQFGVRQKRELTQLKITSTDNTVAVIAVESGPPYFGLWNVLLHIAKKNRHRRQRL